MCSLSCTEDAADNTLMVENFAFGHGGLTSLKSGRTNRNCLKLLYHIAASGVIEKPEKPN
jgi:hypothetical protein